MSGLALDPAARAVLRGALALLFTAALVHKLRRPTAFRAALAGLSGLPAPALPPAAAGVLAAEGALALGLALPGTGAAPALGAAALLVLYSAAIAARLARGHRDRPCGCGGPLDRGRLGPELLVRNAALVAAAGAAALPATARPWAALDVFTVAAGIAAAALLHAAAATALANAAHPVSTRISARVSTRGPARSAP